MKRYGYILFTAFLILLIQSCVKEVAFKPKGTIALTPVFHAYMCPDSQLRASFFSTDGVLNPDAPVVNNNVKLSIGFNDYFFAYLNQGKYFLGSNPLTPNTHYKLAFEFNNKTYLTDGRVPNKINILHLDTQTGPRASFGKTFVIKFKFADSAGYNNYYHIYLRKYFYEYKKVNNVIVDSTLKSAIISVYGNELAFVQNNFNNYSNKEILFDDQTFNGVTTNYEVYTNTSLARDANTRTFKIELVLENIEKSLYNYYNSRNAHLWQQNSITQTPGIVQGNIPDALGVVGSYTQARYEIMLK